MYLALNVLNFFSLNEERFFKLMKTLMDKLLSQVLQMAPRTSIKQQFTTQS